MKNLLSNFVLRANANKTTKDDPFVYKERHDPGRTMKALVTKHQLLSRMIILIKLQNSSNEDIDVSIFDYFEFVRQQTKLLPFFDFFFKDVEELQIRKICSQFKIETFQPLDVIIQQNDDSNDKMYVVVIGSVSVCVQGPGEMDVINQGDQTQKFVKRMSRLYSRHGRPIHVIQAGQGFGEVYIQIIVSLLYKPKIKKMLKEKLLQSQFQKLNVLSWTNRVTNHLCNTLKKLSIKIVQLHQNLEFISAYFPFISELSSFQQKQFFFVNIVEKFYSKGRLICQEGSSEQLIYILVKGSAQIFKNIKYQTKVQEIQQKVLLLDLSIGEMIGDEILFNTDNLYEYEVRVSSVESTIYTIQKSIILNRFPSHLVENFHINYKLKKKLRDQRVDIFLQEMQEKQQAEINNNITNKICDVNNKALLGRMIPQILKQKTKMQLQIYDNVAIRQLENEQHEFDQHQTERLFKEHVKNKKQKVIMTYQAHQLRGRDLQQLNKDRYAQLVGVINSRTKTDDQNYIEKLMGDESDLISNVNTNKFFTINHYSNSPPIYRRITPIRGQQIDSSHSSESLLDFGYMKDFERQKKFKMIQMYIGKPTQDKKTLFEQLQDSMGRIIHKYKKVHFPKQENYQIKHKTSTDDIDTKSDDLFDDPYLIQDKLHNAQQERRKILMKKTRRLNQVNERIKKKYHTTEPSANNSD